MHALPAPPAAPTRTRRRQLAATAAVVLLALALVGWLLLRPAPAVPGAGTTPGAAPAAGVGVPLSPAASSSTPAAAPSSASTSSNPSQAALPTLVVTSPTTSAAGPDASVPGGAPVLFVGDGLDPSGGAADWSALVASTLAGAGTPLDRSVAAADGAGWAATSTDGRTFTDLLSAVATPSTRVVVVMGSRNDLADPDAVAAGASRALQAARAAAPQAQLVVVAPPALGDGGTPALVEQRRELATAAAAAGAAYLDPAASGQTLQPDATSTADGTVRLTAAGQVQLAQAVLPVVQRLVAAPAATS